MHVLFLPKWYPGRNDPQLGDFIRKQALAVALHTRTSALVISMEKGPGAGGQEVKEEGGLWELHCHYRCSTWSFAPLRKAVNFSRFWRAAMHGWRRVVRERGRPDLLHVHIMVRPAIIAWWASWWHQLPFIISEQSSQYLDGTYARKSVMAKAAHHFLFRRARRITAVSRHLGDALMKHGLCSNCAVVPNVVPGTDRPLPAAGRAGSFMVVADLVDRTKNVSGVLRAFAVAMKQNPQLRLEIIGDGPDGAALRELSHRLGSNGSVRFLGRLSQPEVLDHMARTGAVVVNSNVETFSVVTGEALALGKPVIATRCGGPQAFITDDNGMLIDPRDEGALAGRMLAMASSADRYDPRKIRESVSGRYGPHAVGRAFMEIYSSVLAHDAR